MNQHKELPMLAGIAAIIRWFEELINLLSGPLLTLGLGIALIDLLTDGSLLARLPLLLYAWAISQAVGVDAQLVATWDRARIALRERRYWALVGLLILGAVLAYVAWIAAQVFALQESESITTGQALTQLGMDSTSWLVQRTALSVALVCLAGWTRYHPPVRSVSADAQAEREQLEADIMLEPLRQRKRAMQARALRSVGAAIIGKDTALPIEAMSAPSSAHTDASLLPVVQTVAGGVEPQALVEVEPSASALVEPSLPASEAVAVSEAAADPSDPSDPSEALPAALFTPWHMLPSEFRTPPHVAFAEPVAMAPETPPEKPPTGPGSPARKRRPRERVKTPVSPYDTKVLQLPRRKPRKAGRVAPVRRVARGTVEPLARRAFIPGMTAGDLARLAGISKGAASKWRAILQMEADAATTQAQPSDQEQQAAQ